MEQLVETLRADAGIRETDEDRDIYIEHFFSWVRLMD
jgi:hypothetical protein